MKTSNNTNMINSKKIMRITAIILMLVMGVGAIAAGYSFIVDPSGQGIGITTAYLQYSPFNDFLIPGIVLFTFNGVFNIATAIATFFKAIYHPYFILFQGCILTGWIAVQVIMVHDFNLLHLICLVTGITLMIIGWRLRVQN